jgi:hypothetical protein
MSQVGDGITNPDDATTQAIAGLCHDGGSGRPIDQTSRPPSIRGDDSNSSDESEGETLDARRRRN